MCKGQIFSLLSASCFSIYFLPPSKSSNEIKSELSHHPAPFAWHLDAAPLHDGLLSESFCVAGLSVTCVTGLGWQNIRADLFITVLLNTIRLRHWSVSSWLDSSGPSFYRVGTSWPSGSFWSVTYHSKVSTGVSTQWLSTLEQFTLPLFTSGRHKLYVVLFKRFGLFDKVRYECKTCSSSVLQLTAECESSFIIGIHGLIFGSRVETDTPFCQALDFFRTCLSLLLLLLLLNACHWTCGRKSGRRHVWSLTCIKRAAVCLKPAAFQVPAAQKLNLSRCNAPMNVRHFQNTLIRSINSQDRNSSTV